MRVADLHKENLVSKSREETNGKAVEGAAVPGLAGMPQQYTVMQMQAFKSGARPATVMHQIAKGFSDEQIQQLAAYFAAQR